MNAVMNLENAVRDMDDTTLPIWADQREENGDSEGADALRALPDVLARIRAGIQSEVEWGVRRAKIQVVLSHGRRWSCVPVDFTRTDLLHIRTETPQSFLPNLEATTGQHDAVRVVVTRWNEFNAAIEWLARHLGLLVVELSFGDGMEEFSADHPDWGPFYLRKQHLRPLVGVPHDCIMRQPHKRGTRIDADEQDG